MKTLALLLLPLLAALAAARRPALRSLSLVADEGGGRLAAPSPTLVRLPDLRLVRASTRSARQGARANSSSAEVDVRVGSEGHGHTFPGATTPWGMVVATPWAHGVNDRWDSQAGFHPSGKAHGTLDFHGMAHTALSGAGSGELGELRLLPLGRGQQASYLSTDSVLGSPGYFFGVSGPSLDSCQVRLEATATARGALHRFSFPEASATCDPQRDFPQRLVRLSLGERRDWFYGYQLKDHRLHSVGDRRLEGCTASENSGIGGADQYMCFVISFDTPFEPLPDSDQLDSEVVLEFPPATTSLVARVAVSRTGLEHARGTLDRELGEKSFEEIRSAAEGLWEAALGVVKVETQLVNRTREFYTALYHSMLFPSLMSEEDGSYRLQRGGGRASAMKGEPLRLDTVEEVLPLRKTKPGHKFYCTFSLWDTYRTLHPLMNLLHPQVSTDFGQSLLAMSEAWGFLPPWQLVQSPSDMMEGDGGSITLGMMARDGLLDATEVFTAMKRNRKHSRAHQYSDAGFYAQVSRAIEEARADQCAANVAKLAGSATDAREFEKHAASLFENFDQKFKVFKPHYERSLMERNIHTIGFDRAYAEGTPLQYSWSAEWNLTKLVELHGGSDAFTCDLDSFFNEAPEPLGSQADVTGNLHGFSMGNEPDFSAPYLFSMVGRPARTQAVVDQLVKGMYSSRADGLPGNDDLGAMSAWLVFSMLGFFPVDACGKDAAIGRPFVSSASLQLSGGTLRIRVEGHGDDSKYLERLTWNGKDLDVGRGPAAGQPLTLPWAELQQGGQLVFHMTSSAPAENLHC